MVRRTIVCGIVLLLLGACSPGPSRTLTVLSAQEVRAVLGQQLPMGEGAIWEVQTVAEAEEASLVEIHSCSTCPQVPFGYENERWQEFKAQLQRGDLLVYFRSDRASWAAMGGREGYAIIRGKEVVTMLITELN